MPPPKLFCDKTHFIWKPNVCLIRAKNNYNLAATETTTSLFNYAKEKRVLKCLSGDVKRFPGLSVSYECDSSTITPFGSQEESKGSRDGNPRKRLCPRPSHQAPWRQCWVQHCLQCFTPERRRGQGRTGCTPAVYFSLAQNTFIRKLKSGKKLKCSGYG